MYQIMKYLNIVGVFLGLACVLLLIQQPTNAATIPQTNIPITQKVKVDSNVLDHGVDGTCKWDVIKDSDDVVLNIHAGQLDNRYIINIFNDYKESSEINKIVIDPNVIAPKNSSDLFQSLFNVKEFVGLSNLDTSQVTNMEQMFYSCGVKELDLSSWNTSNVTNMNSMFFQCNKLEKVNVQNWNTSNVEDMSGMFFACSKLHKLDLSNFETPNLKMEEMMFGEDAIYDLDIRNFDSSHANSYDLFDICQIYKITVGPKFKDTFPYFFSTDLPFEEDGIMYITTSNNWVALDGPDKGSKKEPYAMKYVTRTQPVTYEVEHMPLENKSYTEYKTITRTINLHLRSTQSATDILDTSIKQKATIHRQVTTDENGQKTYGEWSQDYWEEYNAPHTSISNPNPAKVSKQIVDGNTQDQTVDIYYP